MSEQTKRKKWDWIGQTLRKDNKDITKHALKWTKEGDRNRGRPATSWRKVTERERTETGRSWGQLTRMANDKQEWKCFVEALCSEKE